jgi:hypothetical protein
VRLNRSYAELPSYHRQRPLTWHSFGVLQSNVVKSRASICRPACCGCRKLKLPSGTCGGQQGAQSPCCMALQLHGFVSCRSSTLQLYDHATSTTEVGTVVHATEALNGQQGDATPRSTMQCICHAVRHRECTHWARQAAQAADALQHVAQRQHARLPAVTFVPPWQLLPERHLVDVQRREACRRLCIAVLAPHDQADYRLLCGALQYMRAAPAHNPLR